MYTCTNWVFTPATVIDHRLATVQTMPYCFIVNVINGSLTAVATVKGIHRVHAVPIAVRNASTSVMSRTAEKA